MAKQTFEDKIKELEEILNELENNKEISLDTSLSLYEKGIKLIKECTRTIEDAQKKIENISTEE
jgi:exodeoxyribonuclease VII small subunit